VDEIDIWRAAQLLILQHGEGALQEAARLGGAAVGKGDQEGERVWAEILKAIKNAAGVEIARCTALSTPRLVTAPIVVLVDGLGTNMRYCRPSSQ